MTDLTEYVEVAARSLRLDMTSGMCTLGEVCTLCDCWDSAGQDAYARSFARNAMAAVAPLIERDARAAALEEAADELDLPGSDASGYYASEAVGGYREAERHAEAWLRDRAQALREGR